MRQQHMTNIPTAISDLPPEQQAIRDKCFHPTGKFIEFKKEEVEQSIPERFEQMVRLYPDRLAVKTKNHTFTYNQLNKAANRVAHAILAKREKRAEPIVLLLENDAPMIAAILGVLKAGKTCVPMDPFFPLERSGSILEDSQAGLLVTDNQNLSLSNELTRNARQVINIDEIGASLCDENLNLSMSPDALSFILYTSGSTGEPKGVIQNHRTTLHRIMNYTNSFHFSVEDRFCLLVSFNFSAAVTNIFRALLNGATLCTFNLKEEGLANLACWLIQEEITAYYSATTVFRHLIDSLTNDEQFPKLRLVGLAGEPVAVSDVQLYKKHFSPDCILVNTLGSTEAGSLRHYLVHKKTPITGSIVPAGYAVEDTEILLLDDAGKEVGFNQVGEIAVKSRNLSMK